MSTYIHQPWSPHASFRKRSGQPVGVGITLHALWVTAYAGVRAVLVNLYVKVINEAASHPPGTATGYLLAGYGEVIMEFASDRPMRWDVIEFFARMMLERVLNGEQNFYIADIVTEFPGALGQQTIHFLMASPATASDTADEAWAGVLQNWLLRVGIGS
ncbi:MAG: hypothetical protein LQ338_002238 [Usnochroma carphineum]|nr:MAG: hypothetical protein LQ338_002238 [Usnochroma carphineum]